MARQLRTGADVNNQRIVNVGDPTTGTDAANKQYVDNVAAGLDPKQSVRVASTTNVNISSPGATINGVTMAGGDRVLLKDQTAAAENGIYQWNSSSTAMTRTADGSQGRLTAGALVSVEEGSVDGDTLWLLVTNNPITVGTTSQVWSKFNAGVAYSAGNGGILVSGNQISAVAKGSGGLAIDSNGIYIDQAQLKTMGYVLAYDADIASGSTSANVVHNLNSLWPDVTFYDKVAKTPVDLDYVIVDANTITVTAASAIGSGQYRVVVMGK